MSTRGTYGFRVGNVDKLSYLPHDAFPSGFGVEFCEFLKQYSKSELFELASALKPARDADGQPSLEDVAKYKEFLGIHAAYSPLKWTELLALARGNLNALDRGLTLYLPSEFIYDSLFCEWAYIADLDADVLEIYRGAQTELGTGRYNQEFRPRQGAAPGAPVSEYTGCKRIATLPLKTLGKMSLTEYAMFMSLVHRWDNEKDLVAEGVPLEFPATAGLELLRAKYEPGFTLGDTVSAIRVSDPISPSNVRGLTKSEAAAVVKEVMGVPVDDLQQFGKDIRVIAEQARSLGFVTLVSDEKAPDNQNVTADETLDLLTTLKSQIEALAEQAWEASNLLSADNWRELNRYAQAQLNQVKAFSAYISEKRDKA